MAVGTLYRRAFVHLLVAVFALLVGSVLHGWSFALRGGLVAFAAFFIDGSAGHGVVAVFTGYAGQGGMLFMVEGDVAVRSIQHDAVGSGGVGDGGDKTQHRNYCKNLFEHIRHDLFLRFMVIAEIA